MKIFVAVGTTEFKKLTDALTSQRGCAALSGHSVTMQYGSAKPTQIPEGWNCFDYTREFPRFVEEADLVISHAAAGTRLDVLSAGRPHLIVCNDTLAGNHQMEMVRALKDSKSCRAFASTEELLAYLESGKLAEDAALMAKEASPRGEEEEKFAQLVRDVQASKAGNKACKRAFVWAVVGSFFAALGLKLVK